MVIMSIEIYESAMYRDIEISEKQIEAGQVRDARTHSGKRGQSMDYILVISEHADELFDNSVYYID